MAKKKAQRPGPQRSKAIDPPFARLSRPSPFDRRDRINIAIVVVLALAVRLTYFFIDKNANPLFYHPLLDSLFHDEWARDILAGNFWGSEVFFRAPLYPYFLAFLYKISGSSIAFAVLVQHVIGTLTVVFVYLLARTFFTARVALLSGILAALYWPLIYFEDDLLIVTLAVCLDVAMLLALQTGARRASNRVMALAGIIMGLSAVARPSILAMVFVLPFALRAVASGSGTTGAKDAAPTRVSGWRIQFLAILSGLALVVAPVLVRNYVVGRDFVPIASQGGVNFYIGNNPQSNGTAAVIPGIRSDLEGAYRGAIELAEKDVGRKLKPSQVSNYYLKKGLDFIVSDPSNALALTGIKLYYFWAATERSNTKYIQFFWRHYGLGRIPLPGFWLIGPLGLLGGILLWGKRRQLAFPYLFVASYTVGVVIFFVNARFRLPVVPVLIIFSAYALAYLFEAYKTHRAEFAKALLVLTVCAAIVNYDLIPMHGARSFDEAATYYELGLAYVKSDKKALALASFERAHDTNARRPTTAYGQISGAVDFHLGVLYREKGLKARAAAAFERIPPNDPAALYAGQFLGELYTQLGQLQQAVQAYNRVLASSPGDATSLLGLATVYKMSGNVDSMNETIEKLRSHYPNNPQVMEDIRKLRSQ